MTVLPSRRSARNRSASPNRSPAATAAKQPPTARWLIERCRAIGEVAALVAQDVEHGLAMGQNNVPGAAKLLCRMTLPLLNLALGGVGEFTPWSTEWRQWLHGGTAKPRRGASVRRAKR